MNRVLLGPSSLMLEGMSIFKGKLIILLHMKNLNKLCPQDKKTNNFSNSLVPKRVPSGSVRFYPTCSKPKDKVKVAVESTDLVVWGKNLSSSVGYKRFSNWISKSMVLPPFQRDIVVGVLLSDGWLTIASATHKNYRLGLTQSLANFKYAWSVFTLLSPYCSSYPISRGRERLGIISYSIEFFTRSLPCFTELHSIFYANGVKVIPHNIYALLTPVALAHWICGDGSARPHGLEICTDSYDLPNIIRLMNVLIIRYRLDCNLRKHGQDYRIYIRQASMSTLKNIVEPYMVQAMMYKLGK